MTWAQLKSMYDNAVKWLEKNIPKYREEGFKVSDLVSSCFSSWEDAWNTLGGHPPKVVKARK